LSKSAEAEGVVSKVQVKKEIKTIVENLETILGDLKDVAKELKEVVHDIDTLTGDLQLEEDGLTDSSKTDTLNSSSSSTTTTTTASSLEKMKLFPDDCIFKLPAPIAPAPVHPHAVLTVLKKPHPPLPPPRLTPLRAEEHNIKNLESRERERVRFSEKVQYHGYCPDCDLQYDVDDTELHIQAELNDLRLSPVHSFPPTTNTPLPCVPPHPPSLKPQKTILRKSTTTTV
uniref:Proline rich 16 n=1 Tax=Labrus bergylta TaxID=56723 RepID=A0A3Q3MQC8_9LABR